MKKVEKAKTSLKEFFQNFKKVARRPDMVVLPGNLAFFFMLSIIPFLALMSYGASILNLSTDFLYNFVSSSFSKELADGILGANLSSGANFFITLLFGIYIAGNGADSIITASNSIYGIENKSWLKRRWKAFWLSILIVILLIFMLIVPVFGETIVGLIKEVNLNDAVIERIMEIFNLLKSPIYWLIVFVIIRIVYTVAPDKRPKHRVINYGALFTTVFWIGGTKIYSMYVTNLADYSALYGGLSSIAVLMIWIYYLSYIFTIGIALNSQKDEKKLSKTGTIKKIDE